MGNLIGNPMGRSLGSHGIFPLPNYSHSFPWDFPLRMSCNGCERYVSTFISAAIIRGTPTHLHCRFRCRQHNNTRELNRTDVTNNDDFDARGGTKHSSIVAEIHVIEEVAGDKLMSNMSDTTTPVLNQHTCCVVLTCPAPSLSSGNYLCSFQSATKNREHLRWMHGTTSSTPHNGLPTSSFILLPHCGAQLFKREFSNILLYPGIYP